MLWFFGVIVVVVIIVAVVIVAPNAAYCAWYICYSLNKEAHNIPSYRTSHTHSHRHQNPQTANFKWYATDAHNLHNIRIKRCIWNAFLPVCCSFCCCRVARFVCWLFGLAFDEQRAHATHSFDGFHCCCCCSCFVSDSQFYESALNANLPHHIKS